MNTNHTLLVRDYISTNYDGLKQQFVKSFKSKNIRFDEDIFHSTILRCMDMEFPCKEELENYLFASLLTNHKRDKLYYANSHRQEVEDITCVYESQPSFIDTESIIDLNFVKEELCNKFGEEMTQIFLDHCYGYPIQELEKVYDVKNLTYKINKMKKFVKSRF